MKPLLEFKLWGAEENTEKQTIPEVRSEREEGVKFSLTLTSVR